MKIILLLSISFLLIHCSSSPESDEETSGNFMEFQPKQEEIDEIAMENQPAIIQDFFSLNPSFFGERFCHDTEELKQLVLNNIISEEGWSQYEISGDYLTFYHATCGVMLEFMTYTVKDKKAAFLSQMNGGIQEFTCLNWDASKNKWLKQKNYPRPKMTDYFKGLNAEQIDLVEEYGYDFIYINPGTKSCTFLFSEWAMEMNMGEKQLISFNEKPSLTFELRKKENGLKLISHELYETDVKMEKYLVAYYLNDEPDSIFETVYEKVIEKISSHEIDHQLYPVGNNDGFAIFTDRSFDFSFLKKSSVKSGFWLFQEGKEPLDLGENYTPQSVLNQANTYFE